MRTGAGWVHAALIRAIILPLIYALGTERSDAVQYSLFFRGLLIAVPIVITGIAIDRCRSLLSYLLVCLVTFAATGVLGVAVGGSLAPRWVFYGYVFALLLETLLIMLERLSGRIHKKEEREAVQGTDLYWKPSYDAIKKPSFPVLAYFAVVYVAAKNVNSPAVCNIALCSAAVYGLAVILYRYIDETERYLALNRRTCNLPSRRIYGISGVMLAVLILLLVVAVVPSFLTIGKRSYRDIREWTPIVELQSEDPLMPENTDGGGGDFMMDMLEEYGEPAEPSAFVVALSYAAAAGVFVLLAVMIYRKMKEVFEGFRETNDENGDIVEELETGVKPQKEPMRRKPGRLTERERIRRQYRQTIRRHRKDRPAVSETPYEIERNAGIEQNEEQRALHVLYEKVRYGREKV